MKIFRLFLAIFISVIITGTLSAQDVSYDVLYDKILNNSLPSILSPNAATFSNYVKYPTASNTGQVSIQHPIYTLKERDLTLDIGLFYNPNSLKVNNRASWVGAGWGLQAGGVITREVKHLPDDIYSVQHDQFLVNYGNSWVGNLGWIQNFSTWKGDKRISNFPEDFDDHALVGPESDRYAGYGLKMVNGTQENWLLDMEPDIFTANINGQSFKFIFSEDGVPKILEDYNNYKIEFERVGTMSGAISHGDRYYYRVDPNINKFIVTDPNGYKYEFEDIEYTIPIRKYRQFSYSYDHFTVVYQEEAPHATAWYLSKITSPTGNVLRFDYATYHYQDTIPMAAYGGYCETGTCNTNDANRNWFSYNKTVDLDVASILSSETNVKLITRNGSGETEQVINYTEIDLNPTYKIQAKYLSRIYSDNINIDFTKINREDYPGMPKLSEILVNYLPYSEQVKRFKLEHFYQEADDYTFDIPEFDRKRLFLESVTEYGDGNDGLITQFVYNSTKLPGRYSTEQDAWGYYNNNNAYSLIPALYVYPALSGPQRYSIYPSTNQSLNEHILPGADRTVNENYILAGTLEKIIFPTGGEREYTFESNKYVDNVLGNTFNGGGLRIKEIKHYDGKDHSNDIVRTYEYQNGQLWAHPVYAHSTGFFNFNGLTPTIFFHTDELKAYVLSSLDPDDYVSSEFDKWDKFTKRSTHSFNTLTNLNGESVFYQEVKEIIQGGNGGYNIYEYSPALTYIENTPENFETRLVVPNEYSQIRYLGPGGMEHGHVSILDHLSFGYVRRGAESLLPFPPVSAHITSDLKKGKLIKKSIFDKNDKLIKELEYNYETQAVQDYEEVYGLRYMHNDMSHWQYAYSLYYSQYSLYKYLTNIKVVQEEVSITNYDSESTSGDKYITETTNYTYNNYGQLATISSTNSNGDLAKTQYKYPLDFLVQTEPCDANSESNILINMVNNNMIDLPLEVTKYKNNKITQNTIYQYKEDDGNLVLADVYGLDINIPITDLANTEFEVELDAGDEYCLDDFVFDSRHSLKLAFDDYDEFGNILQYHKANDGYYSYLWGYDGLYPIAEIKNAQYNQVYFQDFEGNTSVSQPWCNNSTASTQGISSLAYTGIRSLTINTTSVSGIKNASLVIPKSEIPDNAAYIFKATVMVDMYEGDNPSAHIRFYHYKDGVQSSTPAVSYSGSGDWEQLTCELNLEGISKPDSIEARIYTNDGTWTKWDDILVYPLGSQVTTYTYDPMVGINSKTETNGRAMFYEYDDFERLITIKDYDKNILENYSYNYPPVEPNIVITPGSYTFNPTVVGMQSDWITFKVRNIGLKKANIESIDITNDDQEHYVLAGDITTGPLYYNEEKEMKIALKPLSLNMDGQAYLSLQYDGINSKAELIGESVESMLELTPESYTFPATVVETQSDWVPFTVKNVGGKTLEIQSVYLSNDGRENYIIHPSDIGGFYLDHNEQKNIRVAFYPLELNAETEARLSFECQECLSIESVRIDAIDVLVCPDELLCNCPSPYFTVELTDNFQNKLTAVGVDCTDPNVNITWDFSVGSIFAQDNCSIEIDFGVYGYFDVTMSVYYNGCLVRTYTGTVYSEVD